ncbi:hypothetical protein BS78_09G214400 [Paspalum vaginatum]|nr:hypothetical protein BS78_09G214400 [Paspalum vaginatum]
MAAKANLRLLISVLAFTMLIALAHGSPYVFKIHIFQNCMPVIKKDPPHKAPSTKCINTVTKSNILSICSVLNEDDEKRISVARLVELGRRFGQTFPAGARCGTTYIIPELHETPPPATPHPSTSMSSL